MKNRLFGNAVILLETALVFVIGFNADSNSGNFLLSIDNRGPHRPLCGRPFPKFPKKSNYKVNLNYWFLLLFTHFTPIFWLFI